MRYFRDRSRPPQQPSTHTYRLSKFLKNRCVAAAKKRDYVEPTSPCQAFRESFLRRPGKHPNDPTPKPSTASPLPASLRLRSSTAALEEVRIIDTQTLRSSTKNGKNTDALMRETAAPARACRSAYRNRLRRACAVQPSGPSAACCETQRARTRKRLSSEREPGFAPAGTPTGTAAKCARGWAPLRRAGIESSKAGALGASNPAAHPRPQESHSTWNTCS